MINFLLGRYN